MQRNITLDYFKIILSVLVIMIHCQDLFSRTSILGWIISNGMARIAVPCFFVVSGYLIHPKMDDPKILRGYILHILTIYTVWSIIYIPTYIHCIEYRSLVTFALMGYYHLWYLPGLIFAIISLHFLIKIQKRNSALLAILAISVFVAGYILQIAGAPYRLTCNGLFIGLPFITLGYLIKAKENILRVWSKGPNLYIVLFLSFIFLLVESYLSYASGQYHDILISLIVFCPCIIILVLKKSKDKEMRSDIIPKLATGIYLSHILVVTHIVPLNETNNIYKLPLIIAISILISIFIILINRRIKILL